MARFSIAELSFQRRKMEGTFQAAEFNELPGTNPATPLAAMRAGTSRRGL